MFSAQVTEMMERVMREAGKHITVPTRQQMLYWEANANRISVSSQDENMNIAMDMLGRLKNDRKFNTAYSQLTSDEKSYITLMLIAAQDLKTLREINQYNREKHIA